MANTLIYSCALRTKVTKIERLLIRTYIIYCLHLHLSKQFICLIFVVLVDFVYETRRWMAKLFKELSPLLYGNGGPIVLVQVSYIQNNITVL